MHINYGTSSGQKTASAQISVIPGAVLGVDLTPPTAGVSTLVVYDSADSNISGKLILCEVIVDAGMMAVNHEFFVPIAINNGIYCTLSTSDSGTGSHYYIRYMGG